MSESLQHSLSRVRPPRVQITYDVEIGDALEKIELPFVVGVLSDLSGDNREKDHLLGKVSEREFIEVDRDNFTSFLAGQKPMLKIEIEDWLTKFELSLIKRLEELAELARHVDKNATGIFILSGCDKLLEESVLKKFPDKEQQALAVFELNEAIQYRGELDPTVRAFLKMLAAFMSTYVPLRDGRLKEGFDQKVMTALQALVSMIGIGKNSSDFNRAIDTLRPTKPATFQSILRFRSIEDFEPQSIMQQIQGIQVEAEKKKRLSDLLHKFETNQEIVDLSKKVVSGELKEVGLDLIRKTMPESTDFQANYLVSVFADLIQEVQDGFISLVGYQKPGDTDFVVETNQVINLLLRRISDIHHTISNQITACLHHPEFQKLEASYRALYYLVMNSETGPRLKIRVLNISRNELQKDLEKAVEFDQSNLFKKVYEAEYGTFGGHPFSLLVGDYEFGRSSRDLGLLTLISGVAAASHAPFVAAASPKLFDMKTFESLGMPRALSGIFESQEMTKWNSFRNSEDSRYVILTLPRFMGRAPYDPENNPSNDFESFKEDMHNREHGNFLWCNSAFALAQRITYSFTRYSWCAAIRGAEGGGAVTNLPIYLHNEDGHKMFVCPTEVSITDRREKELSDLGFVSLVHRKGKDYGVFFSGQTTQRPKVYNTNEATANARLSAILPYVLAASRFAHYLKVIVRDKIGGFLTRENMQTYLNTWIGDYVLGKDDAGQEIKARYPLREARVDVMEEPGKPGVYRAIVYLRPHFQLEELTTSIRLVASLPPPAAQ